MDFQCHLSQTPCLNMNLSLNTITSTLLTTPKGEMERRGMIFCSRCIFIEYSSKRCQASLDCIMTDEIMVEKWTHHGLHALYAMEANTAWHKSICCVLLLDVHTVKDSGEFATVYKIVAI